MTDKIFYSWQSDLPGNTNRNFILTALENAIDNISNDSDLEVEPVIDRDTLGLAGSPDITESIFSKIDKCSVFVGDVSIIESGAKRPCPNPNVLFELGYALKVLGWSRIIMIMNTVYGDPTILPFDLRGKRVLTYSISSESEKAPTRTQLQKTLTYALKTIFENGEQLQSSASVLSRIDTREIDREMFGKFIDVLPSNGSIEFVSQFNMAGFSFSNRNLNDLWKFNNSWNDAEHEFLDIELESSRAKLYELIDEYLAFMALNTFPVMNSHDDSQTVPPEWEINEPERFYSVVNKLHELAGQIFETHQQLVRDARLRLGV